METLFTWLHLSDLGLRVPAGPALASNEGALRPHDRVLAGLRQDLAERAEPRPDALFITGDVTARGTREEAIAARTWLVEAGLTVGLGPDRVFLVPGNHDVDRSPQAGGHTPVPGVPGHDDGRNEALERRLLAELREGKRPLDAALDKPQARAVLAGRLAPFAGLASAFGARSADPRLEWTHAVEGRGGLRVRVVGLCTAWLSLDAADRGKLRLGSGPLARALPAIGAGELVVVLSHHPARGGWLADEEDAAAWLGAHAHAHLTGQVHDEDADGARAGAVLHDHEGGCVWIAAGASPAPADQGEDRRGLGWSLVKVVRAADGDLRLQVTPRRWSASRGRFLADERVVREGRLSAELPLRLRLPGPAPAPPPRPALPTFNGEAKPRAASREEGRITTPKVRAAAAPDLGVSRPPRAQPPPLPQPPPAPPPQPPPLPPLPPAEARGLFEGPGAQAVTPVGCFAGRATDRAALREALAGPDVRCVVVTGLGGVGKTALVRQFVATEASGRFDEGAWVDGRDLAAELARVARRFGAGAGGGAAPRTAEEAGAFLRAALEGRRVLLVIDDVAPGMASVHAFPVPSPASASRLVVTSRIVTLHEDLGHLARPLRLYPWDTAAGRAHLREAVPGLERAPDAVLDGLTAAVGGLPLAVRRIARHLLREGAQATGAPALEALLGRLEREPLATLDGDEGRPGAPFEERTVMATFHGALRGLGDLERRVILALAACAAQTRAEVVGAVAGVRAEEASMALEGLAEQSLVEWTPEAPQPFRLHPVLRALLTSLPGAGAAAAAHDAWITSVTGAISAAGDAGEAARLKDPQGLAHDVDEVLAAVDRRLARNDGVAAWEALSAILGILDRRGMYGEIVAAASRVLAALPPEGPEVAAMLCDLGVSWCSLGDVAEATRCFERALLIAEDRRWHEGQARALAGLGRCYAALGEWQTALTHHKRAASIDEVTGQRAAFANDLGNVGLACRRTGDLSGAIEHLERALALHEELRNQDGAAEALGGLGLCFRDLGEHRSALDYFHRALALDEALGRRAGQATMLGNLGNTYRALGELDQAIEHLERALAAYEELGLLEGQGTALGNLGHCYRALGEKARARSYQERALDVLRRAGLADDHPHVQAMLRALAPRSPGARPPR